MEILASAVLIAVAAVILIASCGRLWPGRLASWLIPAGAAAAVTSLFLDHWPIWRETAGTFGRLIKITVDVLVASYDIPGWVMGLGALCVISAVLLVANLQRGHNDGKANGMRHADEPGDPPTTVTLFGVELRWNHAPTENRILIRDVEVLCPVCLMILERRDSSPWWCIGCQKEYEEVPSDPHHIRMHIEGVIRSWERDQHGARVNGRSDRIANEAEAHPEIGHGIGTVDRRRVARVLGSTEKRLRISERQGNLCKYCAEELSAANLQIDHIVPLKCGGTNDASNLQAVCTECNRRKGTRTDADFRRLYGFL